MQCHELEEQLIQWSDAAACDTFHVLIDDSDVQLSKQGDMIFLYVALPIPAGDEAQLSDALRLAHPSLSRFAGALALAPDDGRLWLIAETPASANIDELTMLLESLLNQRDSWQSMLSTKSNTSSRTPSRRVPEPLFRQGTRYA
jgi:hypothetical protein